MVVPDRVMQAQRLVAAAPLVARARVLVHDQRGHAQALEARAQPDAALTAADDQYIGLHADAQLGFLLLAALGPVLPAFLHAVLGALDAGAALLFLEALEFVEGGQQRPAQPVFQPGVAAPARHGGLEGEPAFGHAVGAAGLAFASPVGRLRGGQRGGQQVLHAVTAFDGLEVPGEADQVAPVAVGGEQLGGGLHVAARERGIEQFEPAGDFIGGAEGAVVGRRGRAGHGVGHVLSPCYVANRRQGADARVIASDMPEWRHALTATLLIAACACCHCASAGFWHQNGCVAAPRASCHSVTAVTGRA